MKIKSIVKSIAAIAVLSGAAVGANAAVYNLGPVAVGVPKDFAALSSGTIADLFTFDLPANGGSGYSVTNFTLLPSSLYNSILSTMSLLTDPDNSVALTGLLNGDEDPVISSVTPGGSSLTMAAPASAGGHMFLYVTGLTTGSAGGIYTGAISVTAVPEPENYAMLLAGLGVMGAIALRRKKKSD